MKKLCGVFFSRLLGLEGRRRRQKFSRPDTFQTVPATVSAPNTNLSKKDITCVYKYEQSLADVRPQNPLC